MRNHGLSITKDLICWLPNFGLFFTFSLLKIIYTRVQNFRSVAFVAVEKNADKQSYKVTQSQSHKQTKRGVCTEKSSPFKPGLRPR